MVHHTQSLGPVASATSNRTLSPLSEQPETLLAVQLGPTDRSPIDQDSVQLSKGAGPAAPGLNSAQQEQQQQQQQQNGATSSTDTNTDKPTNSSLPPTVIPVIPLAKGSPFPAPRKQTVESLREAYNSHLLHSQMSRQLPGRRKSRLDRQVSQDSPPSSTPGKPEVGKDTATKRDSHGGPISAGTAPSAAAPLVTPSYPFPNMGQRFQIAAMSPTSVGPHDRAIPSGTNTPASIAFYPPETNPPTPYENPDFPSPNLYELALILHSEPGMDGFWETVVRIMREFYKAERISLTIPTDLTDLTNSPWGQKATYNEADEDSMSLSYMGEDAAIQRRDFGSNSPNDTTTTILAGGGCGDSNLELPLSPQRGFSQESVETVIIPSDTGGPIFSPVTVDVTDQTNFHGGWTGVDGRVEGVEEQNQPPDMIPDYLMDPLMEEDDSQKGQVFLNLQPLNYEAEPLIDGAGVSRVLERGKTVVLSREYKDMQTKWERIAAQKEEKARLQEQRASERNSTMPPTPGVDAPGAPSFKSKNRRRFPFPSVEDFQLRYRDGNNNTTQQRSPPRGPQFEEFEQAVSSPWSQSPAPSPAMRADPSENPFFQPAKVDEECFNPSAESPQYSIAEPIHAIGLENASTVIHIPLIHPSTSIINFGNRRKAGALLSDVPEKRTPIAILSILSSVIPYPKNLVHSLTHLSPLMATAFALSQAHSNAALQLSHLQFQGPEVAPNQRKQEDIGSSIMSVTSPSDYTKSSTTNSLAGTPNQDLIASFGDPPGKSTSPLASASPKSMNGDGYFGSPTQRPSNVKRRTSTGVYHVPMSPGEQPTPTITKFHPSRVEHLIEEATGRPSRPPMPRTISEVMEPKDNFTRRKEQVDASESEKASDSEREGSVDIASSEDIQTPKAVMTPNTEMGKQTTGFFGTPTDAAAMQKITPANVDAILRTPPIKPHYIAIPSMDIFSPMGVPETPSNVPLPETPLHGPMSAMEPHPRESLKNNFKSNMLGAMPGRGGASTPIMPSATHDLQAVECALESAIYPLPSPSTEELKADSPEGKIDSKKRIPLRRHSSLASTYRHTRLHSRGAEFGASFPTIASSSNLPLSPGYEYMRPNSAKPAYNGQYDNQQKNMPPPSNKLLRTIIDAIPVHVFTAAPQTGETTWVNSRMLSYRGATAEEFMADPYEPFHPDDRANYIRLWLAAVRKGEPFSYQIRIRRFDGHYRWFMIRAVPLRDNRGIIVHWFGTNMDIHDQRIAEVNAARQAEMAESEAKYRSLANSSPQIVFAATLNAGITFANNQWLEYSGQTLDQALQLGFMEFVHPQDRYKCALPGFRMNKMSAGGSGDTSEKEKTGGGAWFKAVGGGVDVVDGEGGKVELMGVKENEAQPPFSTELRLRRKDGQYRWHLVRCVSVEASNVEGLWFGTCTDINDHKLLEQRLKDANDAAKKAMESKTRFLSNMSHEIRTPLIGISGMVNFLLDTPLNGEQLDYCHTISSSSDGLLMVINDILDLSKVEAGMMRLSFEWFRVRSLMEDANELLSTMAISKELELNYLVEESVPSMVSGDRIRLRQVILNIVGNAIKFTSKGEVFTRCFVIEDQEAPPDTVLLGFECSDTGPGFDKKDEELMFKPFSQIDGSSTRAHGGSGLGLVISRQLIELHGGKMTAKSKKGEGSTFYFSALCKTPVLHQDRISSPGAEQSLERVVTFPMPRRQASSDTTCESPPTLVNSPGTPESTVASSSGSSYLPPLSTDAQRALAHPVPSAQDPASMRFSLPTEIQQKVDKAQQSPEASPAKRRAELEKDIIRRKPMGPPSLLSILIVSFMPFSRKAIESHIRTVLPKTIPFEITVVKDLQEGIELVNSDSAKVFSHIVLNIPDYSQIATLTRQIHSSERHASTTIVILTTPHHRTAIIEQNPPLYEKMGARLQFIYKPIKPSRLSVIFDPDKECDASMDRYRHTAQQVVESQKAVFRRMEKEVGHKGHIVLLVEDNLVNQKVLLRFLSRVGVEVETATDGEECVGKVLEKGVGYYSLILCDLHMPRKDGFATCAEIRAWERENRSAAIPIIALSANVMSDVAERCAAAGFSRYVSKPVDFKVLGDTIKELLDPTKNPGLMSDHMEGNESMAVPVN
ncbi:hypothetical protein H072_11136 [Dactylellina haptotyla CBS 200.50]|uniref:Histidine kinase n=1 Tax=Dactylellina haptotyla (strain CBS 200.50) TaxID=1284197 RepID=S8B8T4_DACHA|nr:hypothetical protein H072_11136 [Dactylellina haptotyla CBS 200.50]